MKDLDSPGNEKLVTCFKLMCIASGAECQDYGGAAKKTTESESLSKTHSTENGTQRALNTNLFTANVSASVSVNHSAKGLRSLGRPENYPSAVTMKVIADIPVSRLHSIFP